MGTKCLNKIAPSKERCASNLDELFNEYKQFKMLQKKDEMSSNQEAGTVAYLISVTWLKKYNDFLLSEQFDNNYNANELSYEPDHFTAKHPGPITNYADLCETDNEKTNLFGTDSVKSQPKEYIDNYLDQNKK
mmetsp:Transcript_13296/g.22577  ORF Transcript_13296/g.22577 Transcript_13296/m.22577 type:complete len:133 (-) Transcript_13296:3038-3436(-)